MSDQHRSETRPTRRGAIVAAVGALAAGASWTAGRKVGAAAPLARPSGGGSSTTQCGRCGSPQHTMLDAACPAAAQIL